MMAGPADARPVRGVVLPISQRGSITRRKVLAAAIDVLDSDGLAQFSIRRVANRFGVEAMALYHYVRGREDLLDGAVELVLDDLFTDPEVHANAADWQDYVSRMAHGIRRIAVAHPQVFSLVANRPATPSWLKPPLRTLQWTESFLASLRQFGFDGRAAVSAYRGFCSFLVGHLLLESAGRQGHDGRHVVDQASYPVLTLLRGELQEDHSQADFDEGLAHLLQRLQGPSTISGRAGGLSSAAASAVIPHPRPRS